LSGFDCANALFRARIGTKSDAAASAIFFQFFIPMKTFLLSSLIRFSRMASVAKLFEAGLRHSSIGTKMLL
jgi:hypothetical protein